MSALLRSLALAALVPLASLASGCTFSCDDFAAASVVATVVDEQGEAIEGGSVSFSVDGGASEPCTNETGDGGVWCGVEVEGEFTITAEAQGYESATTMVTVDADRCHVTTETIDLVLLLSP